MILQIKLKYSDYYSPTIYRSRHPKKPITIIIKKKPTSYTDQTPHSQPIPQIQQRHQLVNGFLMLNFSIQSIIQCSADLSK